MHVVHLHRNGGKSLTDELKFGDHFITISEIESSVLIALATSFSILFIDISAKRIVHVIEFEQIIDADKRTTEHTVQSVDFELVNNEQLNAALLFVFEQRVELITCFDFGRGDSFAQQSADVDCLTVLAE